MVLASDGRTGSTGLSPVVKLSKNGGTGVAPSGAVSEIDAANLPGYYKCAGNATDTNTLGPLILCATGAASDVGTAVFDVVAFDPQVDAMGALKPTTAGRTLDVSAGGEAGLDWANVGGQGTSVTLSDTTVNLVATASSVVSLDPEAISSSTFAEGAINASAIAADAGTEIGTAVWATTTRSLSSAGVQAIWDALTSALTTVGSIGKKLADWSIGTAQTGDTFARLGAPAGASTAADIAAAKVDTAAIKLKTDNLPASPAAVGSAMTLADNAITASKMAADASTEIATQVDTTLSGSHGAGTWGAIGGSGAFAVTVTVTDGTDPLQNAAVRLSEGVNVFTGLTDVSGNASFSMNAATYTVALTKAGYSFTPLTRTVTGNQAGTLISDLEMTQVFTPAVPANPDMCLVYGYVRSQSTGLVLAGVTVTATRQPAVPAYAGGILIGTTKSAVSDGAGLFELELEKNSVIDPAGTSWLIVCPAANLSTVQTLTTDTFNLETTVTD